MNCSLFNDGIQWTFNLGPISVNLNAEDLVQKLTIGRQEIPSAEWNLQFQEVQKFLDKHSAGAPIVANQQGFAHMRDELLSNVRCTKDGQN